jgi:hypothetical protein
MILLISLAIRSEFKEREKTNEILYEECYNSPNYRDCKTRVFDNIKILKENRR